MKTLRIALVTAVVLLAGGLAPATAAVEAMSQTFTVTTTTDELDGNCVTDNQATFEGAGDGLSLREAICLANQTTDEDTIILPFATTTMPTMLTLAGAGDDDNLTGDFDITQPLIIDTDGIGSVESTVSDRIFHALSADLTLRNIIMLGGDAPYSGGAIRASGDSLTLESVAVAGSKSNSFAGAIHSEATTTTIRDSVIIENEAASFGGGLVVEGDTLIEHSSIFGNVANSDGGGITNLTNLSTPPTVTIRYTTIANNTAEGSIGGGGIDIFDGAVYNLEHVSLVGNAATDSANAHASAFAFISGGTLNASNTIIAGNTITGAPMPLANQCDEANGTVNLNDHNLLQDGSGCTAGVNDISTVLPTEDIINDTPTSVGILSIHFPLVEGSPAIDAGTCQPGTDRDQTGLILPLGPTCDIGAVEYYPDAEVYTVTRNALTPDTDFGDRVCEDASGECSHLAAYQQAAAYRQPDTIILQEGEVYDLGTETWSFRQELTIEGNGAIMDASNITMPAFQGAAMHFGSRDVTVDRLTVRNSPAAAISLTNAGTQTLTNVALVSNNDGLRLISKSSGEAELINTTIADNTIAGISNAQYLTLVNSIVSGNNGQDLTIATGQEATVSVSYSHIEGGVPAAVDDGNNLDEAPIFANPVAGNYVQVPLSPLVNQGFNNVATSTDLAGNPRIANAVVDLGAYETDTDPFTDVPESLPAPFMEDWVEAFYYVGITGGCTVSPLAYCADQPVTRGEMAVFILRALEFANLPYTPPDDANDPFADVPSLLPAPFMEPWVEEYYARGITQGCATDPLRYCPADNVTRAEMAVFILRALNFLPADDASDPFADVPDPNLPPSFEAYIETFYTLGITQGCAENPLRYCPNDPVTRGAMAVFILRAFDNIPDPEDLP